MAYKPSRNWFHVLIFIVVIVTMFLFVNTMMEHQVMSKEKNQKIRILIGEEREEQLTATLNDSKTTRDFINLLPLNLTLEDYARTEKVCDLPEKLRTEDAPSGSDPSVGDITYYAPWGNLAIFYKDFGYSKGLVIMGRIHESMAPLADTESVKVKIERIE